MGQLRRAHQPNGRVAQDAAPFEIAIERADGRELPGEAATAHPRRAARNALKSAASSPSSAWGCAGWPDDPAGGKRTGREAHIGLDGLGRRPPPAGKPPEPGLHLNRRSRRQKNGNRFRLPAHCPIMARAPYSQVNDGVAIEGSEVVPVRGPALWWRQHRFPSRKGTVHEIACARGGDRRRRGRRLDALSSGQEGLVATSCWSSARS